MLLALVNAAPARAQDSFTFEWRVIATVHRAAEGADRHTTTRHQHNGTATLTLVRDPSPDVRFAFDFVGPDGRGSGLVPRAAEKEIDPNFAFPSPLPPGLPPPDRRFMRGGLRRLVDGPIPRAFEIAYVETFTCRKALSACGNVSSWTVVFIGVARATPRPTR
jgi:hypothetical protein